MYGRSHDGVVYANVMILNLLACMNVNHLLVWCVRRVFANALLCQLVRRLLMCLFVQHDRRWRRLLFCFGGYRLHDGRIVRRYFA